MPRVSRTCIHRKSHWRLSHRAYLVLRIPDRVHTIESPSLLSSAVDLLARSETEVRVAVKQVQSDKEACEESVPGAVGEASDEARDRLQGTSRESLRRRVAGGSITSGQVAATTETAG